MSLALLDVMSLMLKRYDMVAGQNARSAHNCKLSNLPKATIVYLPKRKVIEPEPTEAEPYCRRKCGGMALF